MITYKLYDIYNGLEILGLYETMSEVRAACRKRDVETDGEWCPLLYKDGVMLVDWTY